MRPFACCLIFLVVIGPALSSKADEADDQYAVASRHYSQGNWKFAAEEFLTFLSRHPSHRSANEARFFLGESLVQLSRFDEAAARFKAYLKNDPDGRFAKQARFRAGESAYFAGTTDVAAHELALFRAEYPDDPLNQYVLTYQGEIAAAAGKPDEAALRFRECLKRFPEGRLQDDCRLGLARILEGRGETTEALRILEALAEKPNSNVADSARFRLGALRYALKQYEPAAEAFSRLFRDSPESAKAADARLAYGWSQFKLGRFDKAIAAFDALSSHPRLRTEAGYWKGVAQKSDGQWSEAAETLCVTAAKAGNHPLLPEIRFHAGDALLRAGDVQSAERQFELIVNSDVPEAAGWKNDARLGLIQIAFARDQFDSVLSQTEALLASDLKKDVSEQAVLLRAKALIMSSREKEAAAILEKIQTSDEAKFLLATAYGRSGRTKAARRLFRSVAEQAGPLKVDATLAEADMLGAEKKHDEAIQLLQTVLEQETDLSASDRFEAEGALALAYAKAGKFDLTRKMHSQWAKIGPLPRGLSRLTETLAETAYKAGAYDEALGFFSWLALQSPDADYRERGLLGKGWAEYELGRLDEAGGTFARVVDSDRDPTRGAEAALARGRLLAVNKQEDAALAMFDLVVERYSNGPFVPDALLESARILSRLRQFEQAESRYARILKDYSDYKRADAACYERAWVLHDLGRKEAAYAAFEKVYRDYRGGDVWPDATYRLAKQALDRGDTETASRLTEEVLAACSDSATAADALALKWRLAAARQAWGEVEETAARLLSAFPNHRLATAAEFWRAEAAFRRKDQKAAEQRFDALWEKYRGSNEDWVAAVRLRRAQLAAGAEDWLEARRIASETQKQFPKFPQTYELDYVIGRSLAAEGEFVKAREAYSQVISSETGRKTETAAMAQWMIGETYFHQEDFEAAAKAYLRVEFLYNYPEWEALALLQAGKCYEKLDKSKEAAELYRQLLERFPKDRYADRAKHRLERLQ